MKQGDRFGSYCKVWVTDDDGFQVEHWRLRWTRGEIREELRSIGRTRSIGCEAGIQDDLGDCLEKLGKWWRH